MKIVEKTTNGIEYLDELTGSNGTSFILFPQAEHTPEMVKQAIREIFNDRDVVSLKVANERDWDERYRSEIFAHPLTRMLRWYQINADDYELLNSERKKGTTVTEYVERLVLTNTHDTEEKNLARFGSGMYEL